MEEVRKLVLVPRVNVDRIDPRAIVVVNDIRLCQEFNVLPRTGGLYDQDVLFVHLLQGYLFWSQQRQEIDNRRSASAANRGGRNAI